MTSPPCAEPVVKNTAPLNVLRVTRKDTGKTHSHASWDRMCPKFIEASKRLEYLNPESMYIYFPSDEPWTWEQLRNTVMNGTSANNPNPK